MIITNKNYFGRQPIFNNGDTIKNCNLAQKKKNTEICKGVLGLSFQGCNLMNCKLPEDAKTIDCNLGQGDIPEEAVVTESEFIEKEFETMKSVYGDIAKEQAKKVFNLKEASIGL